MSRFNVHQSIDLNWLVIRARLTVGRGFSHGNSGWDSLPIKSGRLFEKVREWEIPYLAKIGMGNSQRCLGSGWEFFGIWKFYMGFSHLSAI
jgi:hypothetical protein